MRNKLLLIFFLSGTIAFSQEKEKIQIQNFESIKTKTDVVISNSDLERKGIIINNFNQTISQNDLRKIVDFNFDNYRFPTERRIIQIKDGPALELFSFSELKAQGIEYDRDKYSDVLPLNYVKGKHESKPLININFGKKEQAVQLEN